MIYIFSGNDTKKKNIALRKLCKEIEPMFFSGSSVTKESIFDYAGSISLFGGSPIVVIENLIKEGDINFSPSELLSLSESKTIFVFFEEKLLASESKKYIKYATIEDFSTDVVKQAPKIKIFDIADAFSRRDKIGTWILYLDAINVGVSPEEISGIIFWKIKTLLLNGTKIFSKDELKIQSSELVSIYHMAHKGELDFVVGLEQFILSSLSK